MIENYSSLVYSNLFYFILFYSILFYDRLSMRFLSRGGINRGFQVVINTDRRTNVHTTHEEHDVRRSDGRITPASASCDFVHRYI